MILSVVLPAYNEALNLQVIIPIVVDEISKLEIVQDYEIIVCDDHSSDDTYKIIKNLNNDKIKCIRLSRRSGSHTAIRAGIAHSKGDVVLCIAADGQDSISVANEMLKKIFSEGQHIVWAVRSKRDEPFLQKYFSILFYKLLRSLNKNVSDKIDIANADFYMLSRKVVNAINRCEERNTSLFGLFLWLGFKQDYVVYERNERISGKSKWGFRSKIRLAKDWIIAFSGLPLKLMSIIGIIVALLGFFYATFILVYSILGYARPGWAETVILILVIGGTQMFMLGVVGEYLWRNLDEGRKRPLYFIEEASDEK